MDFNQAIALLSGTLQTLAPSGPKGFEGLIRDLLVELTGVSFGVAKSGPQGGSDVRSQGLNLFEVAMEAKRYKANTSLSLDALKAKISETAGSQRGTDLWVLAATREISVTDNEELTRTGSNLGITVLILDWPSEAGQLPDLAVLCAKAPNALRRHLASACPQLEGVMNCIISHPNYAAAASRLESRLKAPDMGYAAATEAMKQWMLGGLGNPHNAAHRLGGKFNDMLAPERHLISRPAYDAQLCHWFTSGEPTVLLGDEGLGKTWLFLSWWYGQTQAKKDLPLTFFVPAQEIEQKPLDELIARLLEKRLGHGNQQFWRRRVNQWLKLRPETPQFLLMIDGLNQYWQMRNWAEILQPAYADEWVGRICVLLSCWPDHWEQLHKLASLSPIPTEIVVQRFNDQELDALLDAHGLTRKSFTAEMLELMRVPRLTSLVILRQRELAASGDITPERLALEDWKNRIDLRGAGLEISDVEFQEFIADLGRRLRNSIENTVVTRANVYERLGQDSGKGRNDLLSTVAEMVSGRWLISTERPHTFKVNPTLMPFALGLALAHQLKPADVDATASATIAEFIDPFSSQPLGVRILRAAATVALLDPGVSRPARRALLTRWINEQNFSSDDFEAFWRIIGLDTELVLHIIEETWLRPRATSTSTDEVFIKALANAHQFEDVAPLLINKITRWLGWFWMDPLKGAMLGKIDEMSAESQQRQSTTSANFSEWTQLDARKSFPDVQLCNYGDASWLSHRVFGIISFLPKGCCVDAIAAWSISRSIMGSPLHFDELAWTLRLNSGDASASRETLWKLVDQLIEVGNRLSFEAARWILRALADPQSENRLHELNQTTGYVSGRPNWRDTDTLNPHAEISPEEHKAAENLTIEEVYSVQPNALALARSNPDRLHQLLSEQVMGTKDMDAADLRQVIDQLHRYLPLLSEGEQEALLSSIDAVIEEESDEIQPSLEWWLARRLEIRLAGASGPEQLQLLIQDARSQRVMRGIKPKLLDFSQDDLRACLGQFSVTDERETIISWLNLLTEYAGKHVIDGWAELPLLLRHEDPEIVELAILLAASSSDPAVHEIIAEGSWSAYNADDRDKSFNRSVALLQASRVLNQPDLLKRADEEMVGVWLTREPDNPDALRAYEAFVREILCRFSSTSGPLTSHLVAHKGSLEVLLDRCDAEFWDWLKQTLEKIEIRNSDLFVEFPLRELAEVLMSRQPELGLMLWRKLTEASQDGVMKLTDMNHLPLLAEGELANAARSEAIDNALNDQELSNVAVRAGRHNQTTWLVEESLKLAHSGTAKSIAAAVTLLGFSDESSEVYAAWNEIRSIVPDQGWLNSVYERARRTYDQNRFARHWYNRYLAATTASEALSALLLLTAAIDTRALHWIRAEQIQPLPPFLQRCWNLNAESLTRAAKRQRDPLKSTLFGTKTMSQSQWPWL
ncbi:NACHT domain-containing protein [Pseudomonas citronellolis]|uniref:NACHT domain-containing protein n=1 Tax=Pseudomonas citronellolis TaxID=53408 RepID=UPI0020A09FF4|nr:NACHT domain-containing protein [Pseudomonas citronellolis]MCP1605980.1 hypothetical protein [Pseudomonas citronellolis]MCP1656610.1 hypothetical protein [Pseudomonas citronellolis]MCP1723639.1 hypothetical protein [Pseudomonas citronellolis]